MIFPSFLGYLVIIETLLELFMVLRNDHMDHEHYDGFKREYYTEDIHKVYRYTSNSLVQSFEQDI